ncbi:unnamed protein product [Angiostrongylus costaricensis]|uniref:Uncharacterized protein n=1 Tax=Angiostrongylus costaricensis TaxID=334426 RepID=A0A0R3Q166_ANGCS|nr:unnamed protein product [Angiostrongylus costaricensis]
MLTYPPFGIRNKNMENVDDDFLYHFGFGTKTMDIPKTFGDTKVILRILVEQTRGVILFFIHEQADVSADFAFLGDWKAQVDSNLFGQTPP